MRPTTTDVRPVANPILTNMLVAYLNKPGDYVARMAAPAVAVTEESGTYPYFQKGFWMKPVLERRAYGSSFARGGYEMSSDTYKTAQWGLEHPIAYEVSATSQLPMRLEQVGLQWLADQSNLRKEISFAADFMALANWTSGDNNSATDWDSTGTPVTNVRTAARTIKQLGAGAANAALMGEIVYDALLTNAEITGSIQYTVSLTMANRQQLVASVLGVDYLLVSRAVNTTTNLGQSSLTITPIIDDDCLVFVLDPSPDMLSVSALKTFTWAPGGGDGSVMSYTSNETRSTILQHSEQWDQKQISADAGYIFIDVV